MRTQGLEQAIVVFNLYARESVVERQMFRRFIVLVFCVAL